MRGCVLRFFEKKLGKKLPETDNNITFIDILRDKGFYKGVSGLNGISTDTFIGFAILHPTASLRGTFASAACGR